MTTPVFPRLSPLLSDEARAFIEARTRKGIETYGEPLLVHNGRCHWQDAAEEAGDLAQYLCGALMRGDPPTPEQARLLRELVALAGTLLDRAHAKSAT